MLHLPSVSTEPVQNNPPAVIGVGGRGCCLPGLLPLRLCPNPLPAGAPGGRSQLAHGLPAWPAGRPGPPAGAGGQAGRAGRPGSSWTAPDSFYLKNVIFMDFGMTFWTTCGGGPLLESSGCQRNLTFLHDLHKMLRK